MTTIPFLPENAPFTAPQRAWLNGFFAGLLGADAAVAQAGNSALLASSAVASEPEDFPWHDPSLNLDERLALADGKPPARRLMAAMAQLDCGQCGYLCQTYAEALAGGSETRMSLCVPGGKETARVLRRLMEQGASAAAPSAPATAPPRTLAPARFNDVRLLTSADSEKDTRHVVLHLNGSGLSYEVGDSFGIQPGNCPDLVADILSSLGASGDELVAASASESRSLRDALTTIVDIGRPSDAAIELLAEYAHTPEEAGQLRAVLAGEAKNPTDPDLFDLLCAFPSARPPVDELIKSLDLLQPRLYSIASSPKAHPGEVHLTVGVVRYERNGRSRKGVASTFLAERVVAGSEIRVFVQRAHGFRLPSDPTRPIIMIGPGTGIAPFRAFLEERRAIGASGRNWLFFGDQRREHDFLYRDELEEWQRDGHARLDLAFSRDQAEKVYVQHRLRERATELWAWLEEGAHLYVCGDAKRMARDVDQSLQAIVAEQSGRSLVDAKAYVAALARESRYQRDVY